MQIKQLVCRHLLLIACVGMVIGCRTSNPDAHGSLAWVTVKGRTTLEAARVTSEVFEKAGFVAVPLDSNKENKLVFEKQGGTGDLLLYGDWSGKKIWYRIKLNFVVLEHDTELITCDAFRVTDHGDSHFEEERKLSHTKGGTCRDLLQQVKAKLEAGGPLGQ
jgi:hypothetical protein